MSKDAFKDMLDGLVQPEEAPTVAPVVEAVPTQEGNGLADDDPYKHLVGCQANISDLQDPFSAMLDGMLASEGMDKNTETADKNPEPEFHNWESDKIAIYEDDEVLMTCSKCCRTMKMNRKETPASAMARHNIALDCAQQVVGEIMTN